MEHPLDINRASFEEIMQLPFMTEELADKILKERRKKNIKKVSSVIGEEEPYSNIIKKMFIIEKRKIEIEGVVNYNYDEVLKYGGLINYRSNKNKDLLSFSTSILYESEEFDQNDVTFSLYGIKKLGFIVGDYKIFSNTGLSFAGRSLLSKVIGDFNKYQIGSSPFIFYPSWRRIRGGSVFYNFGLLKINIFGGMTLKKANIENDSIISFSYTDQGEDFYQYNAGGCLNLKIGKSKLALLSNRFYYQYPVKGETFDLKGNILDIFSIGYSFHSRSVDADIEIAKGKGIGMDSKLNIKMQPFFTGIEIKYIGDTLFLPYGLNYGIKDRHKTKKISFYTYYSNKFFKAGFDLRVSDTSNFELKGNIKVNSDYGSIYGFIGKDYLYSYLKLAPFSSKILNIKFLQKYNDGSFNYGVSIGIKYIIEIKSGFYKHQGGKSLSIYLPSPYPFSISQTLDEDQYLIFSSFEYRWFHLLITYPEKNLALKIKITFN